MSNLSLQHPNDSSTDPLYSETIPLTKTNLSERATGEQGNLEGTHVKQLDPQERSITPSTDPESSDPESSISITSETPSPHSISIASNSSVSTPAASSSIASNDHDDDKTTDTNWDPSIWRDVGISFSDDREIELKDEAQLFTAARSQATKALKLCPPEKVALYSNLEKLQSATLSEVRPQKNEKLLVIPSSLLAIFSSPLLLEEAKDTPELQDSLSQLQNVCLDLALKSQEVFLTKEGIAAEKRVDLYQNGGCQPNPKDAPVLYQGESLKMIDLLKKEIREDATLFKDLLHFTQNVKIDPNDAEIIEKLSGETVANKRDILNNLENISPLFQDSVQETLELGGWLGETPDLVPVTQGSINERILALYTARATFYSQGQMHFVSARASEIDFGNSSVGISPFALYVESGSFIKINNQLARLLKKSAPNLKVIESYNSAFKYNLKSSLAPLSQNKESYRYISWAYENHAELLAATAAHSSEPWQSQLYLREIEYHKKALGNGTTNLANYARAAGDAYRDLNTLYRTNFPEVGKTTDPSKPENYPEPIQSNIKAALKIVKEWELAVENEEKGDQKAAQKAAAKAESISYWEKRTWAQWIAKKIDNIDDALRNL